jgi:hypothetical protein
MNEQTTNKENLKSSNIFVDNKTLIYNFNIVRKAEESKVDSSCRERKNNFNTHILSNMIQKRRNIHRKLSQKRTGKFLVKR